MSSVRITLTAAALVAGIAAGGLQATASAGELPPGSPRVGVLAGGQLLVKEGNLYDSWVPEIDGVQKFEIAGDRIGVLTADSRLLVKEGNLWTNWVEEAVVSATSGSPATGSAWCATTPRPRSRTAR
ncbi:hypothetical protein ACIA5G_04690 [Amycolatopsis sp. NPDC051758]|uniref:hypothetical protein n=1 Tax=Amycolatopsis sp. NPDC051758 TaxID=3363935 RepID=UPI0037889135